MVFLWVSNRKLALTASFSDCSLSMLATLFEGALCFRLRKRKKKRKGNKKNEKKNRSKSKRKRKRKGSRGRNEEMNRII